MDDDPPEEVNVDINWHKKKSCCTRLLFILRMVRGGYSDVSEYPKDQVSECV